MGVIAQILLSVGAIVMSALSQQVADELKAWTPWTTEQLIRLATSRLPADQRERFGEEWRSHVDEIPGEIGRIFVAVGLVIAAFKMAAMLRRAHSGTLLKGGLKRASDLIGSGVILVVCVPSIVAAYLIAPLCSCRLELFRDKRVGLRGREFGMFMFRVLPLQKHSPAGFLNSLAPRRSQILFEWFIGTSGLDSLPQLLNVFRGEMGLVGPAPVSKTVAHHMSQAGRHGK